MVISKTFWHYKYIGILWGALCFIPVENHAAETFLPISDTLVSDTSNTSTAVPTQKLRINDLQSIDTFKVQEKKGRVHSPQKAIIYSAVFPGLGQIYNRKYWKLPIIYGGGVGLYMYYKYWDDLYTEYKTDYENALNEGKDVGQIKLYYDQASRYRSWSVIFMGMFYLANIVDALADAYFFEYDISDNLALKVHPCILSVNNLALNGNSYGFRLSLAF